MFVVVQHAGGLEGLLHVCVHCLIKHPRLEHTLDCDQTISSLLRIETGNTQCEMTVCALKQYVWKGEMYVPCRSIHGYSVSYPQEFSAAPPLALPLLLHLLPGPLLLPSEKYSPPPSNSRPSLARPESPAEIHKHTHVHRWGCHYRVSSSRSRFISCFSPEQWFFVDQVTRKIPPTRQIWCKAITKKNPRLTASLNKSHMWLWTSCAASLRHTHTHTPNTHIFYIKTPHI